MKRTRYILSAASSHENAICVPMSGFVENGVHKAALTLLSGFFVALEKSEEYGYFRGSVIWAWWSST
jgi:hypothetical protein